MTLQPEYAVPGILLAVLFVFCVCNPFGRGVDYAQRGFVLTSKRCGKTWGMCCKWCFILILIPLYALTIAMSVYVFAGDVGMEIIDDVCAEAGDTCTNFFTLNLQYQDSSACDDPLDCDIRAKSGSSHEGQFSNMGLGQDLSTHTVDATYTCDVFTTGCSNASSPDGPTFAGLETLCDDQDCNEWASIFDDVPGESFSYIYCDCQIENATLCGAWDCEISTLEYFYPNSVFAILVGILFVLPILSLMTANTKSQIGKKLIPCSEPEVLVFEQGGGFMSTTGGDLATGGHSADIAAKDKNLGVKSRSFSRYDCALYVLGLAAVIVLSYFMWVAAGYIGIGVLLFDIVLIIVVLLLNWIHFCFITQDKTNKKIQGLNS